MVGETVSHFGRWLARRIEDIPMGQEEFARRAGIPFGTLRVWLSEARPNPRGTNRKRLADALGMTRDELDAMLQSTASSTPVPEEPPVEIHDISPEAPEFSTPQPLYEIPTFDLSLAAGPWTDVMDAPNVCSPDSVRQGLFRVRLAGDSMTPKYKSGMIVEFECLRPGVDRPEPGRDYYVQRDDGAATFKRLESIDDAMMTFRALNGRRFPERITVEQARVVRMALARGEFRPFEEMS